MTDNIQRFTGRADDYDRYRQRYPSLEILNYLRAWCGLAPDWLVADIGAGTGMLAEVFLENGNRVLAVEPNADMRSQMHATFDRLGSCWPRMEIIDATAEATTLPAGSINLIAVGRAFHWFDKLRALDEFRRILKPGGWVTLVALERSRDPSDPFYREQFEAFEQLMVTYGTNYTCACSGYRAHENMETFLDGEFHHVELPGLRQLDWDTFRGHTMSTSIAPAPGHPNHEAFMRELRRHFDTYAPAGVLTVPTTCWINAGRFRTT